MLIIPRCFLKPFVSLSPSPFERHPTSGFLLEGADVHLRRAGLHLGRPAARLRGTGLCLREAGLSSCLQTSRYRLSGYEGCLLQLPLAEGRQPIFAFEWTDPEGEFSGQVTQTRLPQVFKSCPSLFYETLNRNFSSTEQIRRDGSLRVSGCSPGHFHREGMSKCN